MQMIENFMQEEDGVTAIEYGLIAALIAIGLIATLKVLGTELNALFKRVADALAAA